MQRRTATVPLAAGALLALTTLGTNAWADSVIEVDDALAAKVQQQIQLLPAVSGGHSTSGISVQAGNGVLTLSGFVEGLEQRKAINDVIKEIDGLHMDQVDDHIIQQ